MKTFWAEAEIKELQIRYCRGADRMDFDLLRSCFHPDAQTDYGYFGGSVDDFIEAGKAGLEAYLGTTHVTGNQLVEVDGDAAWAEHYTLATHRLPASDEAPLRDFMTSVRYIDRLERRSGEWKIARRKLVLDWVRTEFVPDGTEVPAVEPGRRDRSDASYSRFQST